MISAGAGQVAKVRPAGEEPPPRRHLALDLIRALSALAVCAGHLRAAMFVDYAQAGGLGHAPFYAATGLGHQAVVVFFVLSGFFVGGGVLRARASFSWGDYALARLTRLWIVLVPALVMTAIIDRLLAWVAPGVLEGALADAWASGPGPGTPHDGSIVTLLGNLLFLQTIAVPVYGTNGPLWSLANEFWYYVLFPLLVTGLGGPGARSVPSRIVCLALLGAGLALLPPALLLGGVVWLLGALASRLPAPRSRAALLVALPLFVATLVLSKRLTSPGGSDLLVGLGTTALVLTLPRDVAPWPRSMGAAVARAADMSYSLYLVHFPLVALFGGVAIGVAPWTPGAVAYAVYGLVLACLVGAGAGFWFLFERHTGRARAALGRALRVRENFVSAPPAAR